MTNQVGKRVMLRLRLAGIILLLAILHGVGAAGARGQTSGISAFPKLSAESDWPWWRGPSRNGIASEAASAPVRWSESENVVWQTLVPGRGHSSPTVVGNRVYLATADASQQTQSVLAFDGKEMWKRRLQGPVSASPVLAGGNIYWANELGTMYVFKPNPHEFELVSENQLGHESFASPAVCGGQIFLRVASESSGKRQEMLYCIGDQ